MVNIYLTKIPQHNDTDFMVWMTPANFFNFRKLYRVINVPLDVKTTYNVFVVQSNTIL
jgi:hypothetical protein